MGVASKTPRMLWGPFLLTGLAVALVAWQWASDEVAPGLLLYEVPRLLQVNAFETQYTYLFLDLFTIIPILFLSFDSRVHYHTEWRFLLPAIGLVGAVFVLWDVFFTAQQVWGFNHQYLTGAFLWGLPVEEWLFFLVVPFACTFIYECLNYYVKIDLLAPVERYLSAGLIPLFFFIGFWYWSHQYTATTFILCGAFLLFHVLFVEGRYRSRLYLAYLVSMVPFLLVNGVLTGGFTRQPVVVYNPEEYLGIRMVSVPVDDSAYAFLLIFSTITLFETFRKKGRKK